MKLWDKELGNKIKIRRKSIGLRQVDLANRLYVEPTTISRWETGTGSPDISILPNLSYELGMTLDSLIGNEPKDQTKEIKKVRISWMDVITVMLCVIVIALLIFIPLFEYYMSLGLYLFKRGYIFDTVMNRILIAIFVNTMTIFIVIFKSIKKKIIYQTYKHKYKHEYPAGYKFEIKESYLKFINIKLLLFAIIFDLILILG